MKSKIQTMAEQQRKAEICARAHKDGLDVTSYNFKTLNVVKRLYEAIDGRENKDAALLAEYETNAVSTNALSEETGISHSTLMKQPYAAIIDAHRRLSVKDKKREVQRNLQAENETMSAWKKGHAETELDLYRTKRELEKANNQIRELQAKLERKTDLLNEANDRLREAGLPAIDPMNTVNAYNISLAIRPGDSKS